MYSSWQSLFINIYALKLCRMNVEKKRDSKAHIHTSIHLKKQSSFIFAVNCWWARARERARVSERASFVFLSLIEIWPKNLFTKYPYAHKFSCICRLKQQTKINYFDKSLGEKSESESEELTVELIYTYKTKVRIERETEREKTHQKTFP